jgi:hypothetical protein
MRILTNQIIHHAGRNDTIAPHGSVLGAANGGARRQPGHVLTWRAGTAICKPRTATPVSPTPPDHYCSYLDRNSTKQPVAALLLARQPVNG